MLKNYFKYGIVVMFLLCIVVLITGCGKKGDSLLLGTWRNDDIGMIYIFNEDGTGIVEDQEDEEIINFKWNIKNNFIIVRATDSDEDMEIDYKIDENVLTLVWRYYDFEEKLTLNRVVNQ